MLYNISTLINLIVLLNQADQLPNVGAWETINDKGHTIVMIVTDKHFSLAAYTKEPASFIYTAGGTWKRSGDSKISVQYEYHTSDRNKVGTSDQFDVEIKGKKMTTNGLTWKRIDKGRPGKLEGAWLITGRKRDGEMSFRTPGARKTMKILSGKRFQWIAYNSDTGEFFGTGGGTYKTRNGKYTENIEFFSRDNTRVGAELKFDYEIREGSWHHSGFSSKGDPLYEIWETRQALGM